MASLAANGVGGAGVVAEDHIVADACRRHFVDGFHGRSLPRFPDDTEAMVMFDLVLVEIGQTRATHG
jgi:hypothetical protein